MSITATGDRLEVVRTPGGQDLTQVNETGSGQAETPPAVDAEVPASTRPSFTITDAATACSVSRKTVTRKLPELAEHGAAKDDDGVWRIPVEALLAVGLHPGRSLQAASSVARAAVPAPVPTRPVEQDTITIPRDRWDDVRIRLARAEAEASERGLALADARLALRALTAGPITAVRSQEGNVAAAPQGSPETHAPLEATAGGPPVPGAGAHQATDEAVAAHARGAAPEPAVSVPASPAGAALQEGNPPQMGADDASADIVAARNLAARTGGYVPAVTAPAKKRRWWQAS